MAYGKGTYGSQRGRPSNKKKKDMRKKYTKAQLTKRKKKKA